MSDIIGATFPVPNELLDRVLKEKKNVFVKSATLTRLKPGMKIIFYASRENQGYAGEAEIESVEIVKNPMEILEKYKDRMFLTEKEFKDYVASQKRWGRVRHKPWMAIVLKNIKEYPKRVMPKRFISVAGRYVKKDEYERISKAIE